MSRKNPKYLKKIQEKMEAPKSDNQVTHHNTQDGDGEAMEAVKSKGKDPEKEEVEEEEEGFFKWAESTTARCLDFLDWVEKDYALRATSCEVPRDIFKGTGIYDLKIHDVRVSVQNNRRQRKRKGKGRNPTTEDQVYEKSEHIRRRVARGNTVLTFQRKGHGREQFACFPLRGLKKFTGGMGDDDDQEDGGSEEVWKKFFTKPYDQAKKVVSTTKENGAAAHLAVIKVAEQFFLIGGSKNVHMLIRADKRSDLGLYPRENRYSVAKIVMETIYDSISKLEPSTRERLFEYLSSTHQTACFELLDPDDQHVELLSHLKEPELRFLTFAEAGETENLEEKENVLCVDPSGALEKAASLGLKPIHHELYPLTGEDGKIKSLDHIMMEIRGMHGTEGKVLYFLDEENTVIGLLKKKSVWYIVLRALREKMKGYVYKLRKHTTPEGGVKKMGAYRDVINEHREGVPKRIRVRLKDIQNWLNLHDSTVSSYIALGVAFNTWVADALLQRKITLHELEKKFPVLFNRFLEETKRSDHIEPKFTS